MQIHHNMHASMERFGYPTFKADIRGRSSQSSKGHIEMHIATYRRRKWRAESIELHIEKENGEQSQIGI